MSKLKVLWIWLFLSGLNPKIRSRAEVFDNVEVESFEDFAVSMTIKSQN